MGNPKQGWSWAGAAVLVLAICLGGGWATGLVMSASARTPPITDSVKDLLSSVGGILAGAITAYIGGMIALRRDRHDGPREDVADDDEDEPSINGDG